jgi:hypothetical protein
MFDISRYQFLEWDAEQFNCGDYVRLILHDHLGADIESAPYNGSPLSAAVVLKNYPSRKKFNSVKNPTPFCVVELQRYHAADHVGVYVEINGKPYVTHCEQGANVLLSSLDEINECYKILGYYQYVGCQL